MMIIKQVLLYFATANHICWWLLFTCIIMSSLNGVIKVITIFIINIKNFGCSACERDLSSTCVRVEVSACLVAIIVSGHKLHWHASNLFSLFTITCTTKCIDSNQTTASNNGAHPRQQNGMPERGIQLLNDKYLLSDENQKMTNLEELLAFLKLLKVCVGSYWVLL